MPTGAETVAMRDAKWAVALAVRERLLVVEHPDTLISRHSLAGAYQAAGRLGEAVALYERTLEPGAPTGCRAPREPGLA